MQGQIFACAKCGHEFNNPFECWLHIFTTHRHLDVAVRPPFAKALLREMSVLVEAK